MKKIKTMALPVLALIITTASSQFQRSNSTSHNGNVASIHKTSENQTVNMFVSHGHCITPFAGKVSNLEITTPVLADAGNLFEKMEMSFEIDPRTFEVCVAEELTSIIKTPGVFVGEKGEKLIFRSSEVYTMGMDWYHIKGNLAIRGIEREVSLYVSGIREPQATSPEYLVIEGRFNLMDWGIDYDKIVNGQPSANPDRWVHINMKVKMS